MLTIHVQPSRLGSVALGSKIAQGPSLKVGSLSGAWATIWATSNSSTSQTLLCRVHPSTLQDVKPMKLPRVQVEGGQALWATSNSSTSQPLICLVHPFTLQDVKHMKIPVTEHITRQALVNLNCSWWLHSHSNFRQAFHQLQKMVSAGLTR